MKFTLMNCSPTGRCHVSFWETITCKEIYWPARSCDLFISNQKNDIGTSSVKLIQRAANTLLKISSKEPDTVFLAWVVGILRHLSPCLIAQYPLQSPRTYILFKCKNWRFVIKLNLVFKLGHPLLAANFSLNIRSISSL